MSIGIGMIGSGFIGKVHALAYRAAPAVFGLEAPRLEILADVDAPTTARAAASLGFRRSTGDWHDVVADPGVDVVDVTAPNHLHEPIALATIAAGKADFERLNELRLYRSGQLRGREGTTTILSGPSHPDFAEGLAVQPTVDAIVESDVRRTRVPVDAV